MSLPMFSDAAKRIWDDDYRIFFSNMKYESYVMKILRRISREQNILKIVIFTPRSQEPYLVAVAYFPTSRRMRCWSLLDWEF